MPPAPLIQRVARAMTGAAARYRIDGLRQARDQAGVGFANALEATLGGHPSGDEAAFMARVEALRAREAACEELLEIIDYGAGSRDAQHSPEEAAQGVRSSRTVAACSRAAKPAYWCRFLFHLARESKPMRCVELGTSLGISASYTAGALQLDGAGTLVTLEGAPAIAQRAAANLATLGLDNVRVVPGPFDETLASVLESEAPVDWVFVDGHHHEHATLRYFEQVLPHLSERAVVVFDDISWSPGMRRAWEQICAHPTVALALDLRLLGVCAVTRKGTAGGETFKFSLV